MNRKQAVILFEMACEWEIKGACHNAGILHETSYNQDYGKASEFYRISCDKGNEDSCLAYVKVLQKKQKRDKIEAGLKRY